MNTVVANIKKNLIVQIFNSLFGKEDIDFRKLTGAFIPKLPPKSISSTTLDKSNFSEQSTKSPQPSSKNLPLSTHLKTASLYSTSKCEQHHPTKDKPSIQTPGKPLALQSQNAPHTRETLLQLRNTMPLQKVITSIKVTPPPVPPILEKIQSTSSKSSIVKENAECKLVTSASKLLFYLQIH